MGVPRVVMFLGSYALYTSWNMLLASANKLAPLDGRMGETVTTHLSFVTEIGDISTMPSEYWVAVHVGGVVKTYSLSVAKPVAFDCGPGELLALVEVEAANVGIARKNQVKPST